MTEEAACAAIDLGSTKITTVVGDSTERGLLRVLGAGVTPSAGVEKGQISNIGEAVEAIRLSVEKAERASGLQILSAGVGLSGAHLSSLNNRGIIAIPSLQNAITADDIQRAIDAGRAVSLKTNRELLHALPRYFVVDGQDRVSDPEGMHGQRLDVEMHIVTGSVNVIQNLIKCVEGAGLQVDALIAAPVATGATMLRREEMREGVVLVDIGGGTTDIAVYQEGAIIHTASLPVGGINVTRDIVVGLRCPQSVAEETKIGYGHALAAEVGGDDTINLADFGQERERSVPRNFLGEIIQARVEEILSMVLVEVKRAGHADLISAGFVLTGGTAELPGLVSLTEQISGLPARVGQVEEVYGLTDTVSGPAFAGALGLLRWLMDMQALPSASVRLRVPRGAGVGDLFRRVGQIGRVFLPQ